MKQKISINDLNKLYLISTDVPLKNGEAQDSLFFERVSYKDSSNLIKNFKYFSLKDGLIQSIKHNLPIYNCLNMPKDHIDIIKAYYISNGGKADLIS
jgi:hypothetical protein